MVYRVLSIVANILMGLAGTVLVICLGWTMAVPLFEAGVSGVKASLGNALDAASDAMGVDLSAVGDGWRDQADSLFSAVGDVSWGALGASGGVQGVQNQGWADAYNQWKAVVGDPVGTILSGSGISTSVLEGMAAGSSSATDVLASLDEAALSTIESNAIRYATLVSGAEVPSSLPEAARASMWEANSLALSFAGDVQNLVASVRSVKAGDGLAAFGLPGQASSVVSGLNSMNDCMARAEEALQG